MGASRPLRGAASSGGHRREPLHMHADAFSQSKSILIPERRQNSIASYLRKCIVSPKNISPLCVVLHWPAGNINEGRDHNHGESA